MSSTPPEQSYYDRGSVELAVETPVMRKRLEKRQQLTHNSEQLLLVLVGLPARGKSFLARKLLNYLTWRGNQCRIFNVGKYRREVAAAELSSSQKADFFDDSNESATKLRQKVAEMALRDALDWLGDNKIMEELESASNREEDIAPCSTHSHSLRRQYQRVAIFDATNSTKERRTWILQQCAANNQESGKTTGVVFVESICNDEELLHENCLQKIATCPDFLNVPREEALADLAKRVEKYEARYEPLDEVEDRHLSYIQIFNLSSKIHVNHVYGRLAKVIVPALMAWHTGSRPIYLCRAGETTAMQQYMNRNGRHQHQQQQLNSSNHSHSLQEETETKEGQQNVAASTSSSTKRMRGDRLGERGLQFRNALCEFVKQEGIEFMNRKNVPVLHPREYDTGTSISGITPGPGYVMPAVLPFPCLVMSSTMPRALETASWRQLPFPVKDVSNLNPLDTGDFAGMDLETIRTRYPEWYQQLEKEPFHTRFPGGESYSDLINRLESVVVDMEQQLGPAVVVSHVSVLQVLVSYFRSTPVSECTSIQVPMHTVLQFVPLRGGGWLETHHKLLPNDNNDDDDDVELTTTMQSPQPPPKRPIWGDSRACLPQKLQNLEPTTTPA